MLILQLTTYKIKTNAPSDENVIDVASTCRIAPKWKHTAVIDTLVYKEFSRGLLT